jgi:hypothetical protein
MKIKNIVWETSCFTDYGFDGHCGKFHFYIFKNAFYPEIDKNPYRLIVPFFGSSPRYNGELEDLKNTAQNVLIDIISSVQE